MNTEQTLELLRDRIRSHEDSRVAVQKEMAERCEAFVSETNSMRERLHAEVDTAAREEEEALLGIMSTLAEAEKEGGESNAETQKSIAAGSRALTQLKKYAIKSSPEDKVGPRRLRRRAIAPSPEDPTALRLEITTPRAEEPSKMGTAREVYSALEKAVDEQNTERLRALNEIDARCDALIEQTNAARERASGKLEVAYKAEDSRLQALVCGCSEELKSPGKTERTKEAQAGLVMEQSYALTEDAPLSSSAAGAWDLLVVRGISNFERRAAEGVCVSSVEAGEIHLTFRTPFSEEERAVLEEMGIRDSDTVAKAILREKGECGGTEYAIGENGTIFPEVLKAETEYLLSVVLVHRGKTSAQSEEVTLTTPGFSQCCAWKQNPGIDFGESRRVVINSLGIDSFLVGTTPVPPNRVTSWSIKVLKSEMDDGTEIFIGVSAQCDTGTPDDKMDKWYLCCSSSVLCSGPPHNYIRKAYGPRKGNRQYVHTGDSVGVVMDTAKGDLSFVLNGVNLGVAYEGIPLDKPLLPWIAFHLDGDALELDLSEVKETELDKSILVISDIEALSETYDSITLIWDAVEGASFYQIEVDGSKRLEAKIASMFTEKGLLPESEHVFRVRTVRGNSVSEWSDSVNGKTQKAPDFSECVWKECSDEAEKCSKYTVDEENHRVATKLIMDTCVGIYAVPIGNAPLPPNKVASWSIKVLNSMKNDGLNIWIGVAPSGIDQEARWVYNNCGWYFYCHDSTLRSGPPHKYPGKEYGPRKGDGEYVRSGDSVGVVMDTAKGELSFVLNEVNHGIAYERIPLDKPLVPCVVLKNKDDSVQLISPEVKKK